MGQRRRESDGRAEGVRLDDPKSLVRAYVDEGQSLAAIARMAGCSYATVRRVLLAQGVEIRRSGPAPIVKLRDRTWLAARVREGLSAREIAEVAGCAEETVRSALQWAGLTTAVGRGRPAALDDPSFLRTAYVDEGRPARSIADELGCTKDAVVQALRRHGIPVRPRGRVTTTGAHLAPSTVGAAGLEEAGPGTSSREVGHSEDGVGQPEMEDLPMEDRGSDAAPVASSNVPGELEGQGVPGGRDIGEEPAIRDALDAEAVTPPAEWARRGPPGPGRAPAATLPSGRVDMEIQNIETRTFPIVRRGYDRAEVDAYLRAIAADYREVVSRAAEAVQAARREAAQRAAVPEPAPVPGPPSFDDIGGRVAGVLKGAAEAAAEIKAVAEQEAAAIREKAQEESVEVRQAAADELAEAERVRVVTEEEAAAVLASARSQASTIVAAAHQQAARVEEEAAERTSTLERTTHAKIDALLAEARREYEHLRSVQQQCIDRLASVEFLAKHARDGLSTELGEPLEERL